MGSFCTISSLPWNSVGGEGVGGEFHDLLQGGAGDRPAVFKEENSIYSKCWKI